MTTESLVILFTDVVDSTKRATSVAPERADEDRRRHFAVLRNAIADAGGREVKNLGDGLMAVFSSASGALECAAAMQQGVERDNRLADLPLGLRVGLSGGEVASEGGDYFGDPVVEAARLCARCEAGQILSADVVPTMAGRRNRQECRIVGALTLKGLPDPVPTTEVQWESLTEEDAAGEVPLPGRLTVRPDTGVVGRAAELEVIAATLKDVEAAQRSRILLISGEAGQGKSTLVAEAARLAHDDDVIVLFGHCEEDLATPYQLFSEALDHVATHVSDDLLSDLAEGSSELVRLIPSLSRTIADLPASRGTDAESERYLLFAAVVRFLETLSHDKPVMIVLDDLQWADKASLLLLRHLTGSDFSMKVLVVGTYRDTELSRSDALVETLGALHRQAEMARIELRGLEDNEVLSFMEAVAGHVLDEAAVSLAHAVFRETDGNPFFVSQVMRHLSESGATYRDAEGRWITHGDRGLNVLPAGVREVIGARVVRLGSDAARVLSLASVIGRDFDVELLARAADLAHEDLLDLLDDASDAALIRDFSEAGGRFSFTHALIQRTLYEDLRPTRRAHAHRIVAEALEDLCGTRPEQRVEELARHWCRATQPVDLHKAIEFSRMAGDAALAALAPDDALSHYSQAIELCDRASDVDAELALDLAIGLGTAQRQAGEPAFRSTLLGAAHRAAELDDSPRLVAAAMANDRGTFSTVDTVDDEKLAVLELALERAGTDDPDRAELLAILCSESTVGRSLAHRQSLAQKALEVARSVGGDKTIVRVLNHLLLPLAVPPLVDQVLAWSAEALERAGRLGDPLLLVAAASGRRYAAACAGDVVEMDRCYAIKEPLVAQLDQPFLLWVHTLQQATRALIVGDADEAERLAAQALQIGTDGGEPDAPLAFGFQMLMVSLWRGTMGDLVPLIEGASSQNPGLRVFHAALALAHSEGGRMDEARSFLHDFAASRYVLPMDLTWLTGMTAYASAAIECQEVELAGPLLDQLAPFAHQWHYSDLSAAGPVSRTLGGLATVLGRYDEADAYFRAAAESSAKADAAFFTAWNDLYWGRMLLERHQPGDAEHANQLLSRAKAVSTERGYANVERRATKAIEALP